MAPISMWWFNAGVAPVYYDYELAIQLHSPKGLATIPLPVDVKTWLPGDAVFEDTVFIPFNLSPGLYRFRVALLDPRTSLPSIQLAFSGRQLDGWYDLGEIRVLDESPR